MEFGKLTPYKEVVRCIERNFKELPSEECDVIACSGRVLDEDIASLLNSPPFDRSAMDGYAVVSSDVVGATPTTPVTLEAIENIEAGDYPKEQVTSGNCAKIATGAPIPEGANAVVMKEYTQEYKKTVKILKPVAPWENVAKKGEDFKKGEKILEKGTILSPQALAAARAAGYSTMCVKRKVKAAVLVTGSELVSEPSSSEKGKIPDSNSVMLTSLLSKLDCDPVFLGIVGDDRDRLTKELSKTNNFDLFLVTGGTSVGEKDLLPEIVSPEIHGVAIRPGKPLGLKSNIFLLSGYPVACFIQFYACVIPAIERLYGCTFPLNTIQKTLLEPVSSPLGRRDYVRASFHDDGVVPMRKGSGVISSLLGDGFFIIPESSEGCKKGEEITCYYWP